MKRMFYTITCLSTLLAVCGINAAAQEARQLLEQAQRGDRSAIAELFNAYVNERRQQDWTQLHWAAYQGYEETAQLFLDSGININTEDHYGWTPLHVAAQRGRVHMVQFFAAHNAALNSEDATGHTAVTLAANAGHEAVVRVLLEHGATSEADMLSDDAQLLVARVLEAMHAPVVEEVADQPEEQSLDVELKAIVHAGLSDAQVRALINEQDGTDPITQEDLDANRLDQVIVLSNGQVAVHISAIQGMIDSGRTVRDPYTRERLSQALIDYVRGHGAAQQDDESSDDEGENAQALDMELINAVLHNQNDLVEQLLARGAAVNVRNQGGWTPLILAVSDGNEAMVRMLLAAGADIRITTDAGMSAREFALDGAIIALLEQKELLHAGLTDPQVLALIDEQEGLDAITLGEINRNQLDRVVVLSNGHQVVVTLDTIADLMRAARESYVEPRDPFTQQPLSPELCLYIRRVV